MYFIKSDIDFTISQINDNNLAVEVDANMLCFNQQDASMFQHNDNRHLVGIYDNRDECLHWYGYTTSPNIALGTVYVPINIRVILNLHDKFAIYL